MPASAPCAIAGVRTTPPLTRKTLSAVHSAIRPCAFRSSASCAPWRRASIEASTDGQVVERLHLRRQRVGRRPAQAGRDDHDAVAVGVLRVERERRGDHDHGRALARVRRDAERAVAAGDDEADVAVGEAGAARSPRPAGPRARPASAAARARARAPRPPAGAGAARAGRPCRGRSGCPRRRRRRRGGRGRGPRCVASSLGAPGSVHIGDHGASLRDSLESV